MLICSQNLLISFRNNEKVVCGEIATTLLWVDSFILTERQKYVVEHEIRI